MLLQPQAARHLGGGTGPSTTGSLSASFSWTETVGTHGAVVVSRTSGEVFQGQFCLVTSESVPDYGALWTG